MPRARRDRGGHQRPRARRARRPPLHVARRDLREVPRGRQRGVRRGRHGDRLRRAGHAPRAGLRRGGHRVPRLVARLPARPARARRGGASLARPSRAELEAARAEADEILGAAEVAMEGEAAQDGLTQGAGSGRRHASDRNPDTPTFPTLPRMLLSPKHWVRASRTGTARSVNGCTSPRLYAVFKIASVEVELVPCAGIAHDMTLV